MILDYLTRIEQYDGLLPNLVEVVKFAMNLDNPAVGRFDIGDSFVLAQEFQTKLSSEKDFELHRKYADVHVVLEGVEVLEYEDIANLTPKGEFNETKDMQMLDGVGQPVIIRKGMFCVVFPHDGHKPGCCLDKPSTLRKFVLKIPVKG